jgi:hypothetical protein
MRMLSPDTAQVTRMPLIAARALASSPTPRTRARHLKQILDQLVQLGGGLDDPLERRPIIPAPGFPSAQGDLGLATDHGQRRPEGMADVGEHAPPRLIHLVQGPVALLQLARALLDLALEVRARALQLDAAAFQFRHHPVEAHRQIGELVVAGDPDPVIEAAAGNLPRALGERIDRRLDPPARPQRRDRRADRRDDDHRDRKRRQPPGQPARLRIGDLRLGRFVLDHLVDQRFELAVEPVHVAAQRSGIGSPPGLRHDGDRLLQQLLETREALELEALLRLGLADEGHLVEGQAPQVLDLFAQPAAAREQLLAIDRLPEHGAVAELLEVSVSAQCQLQIDLDLTMREQRPLQPLLHLPRRPGQKKPHDQCRAEEAQEGDR